jgi:hypothetical protein
MTLTIPRSLPRLLISAALALAVLVMPMPHRAHAARKSMHIKINFHTILNGLETALGLTREKIDQAEDRQEATDHPGIGIENEQNDPSVVQFTTEVTKTDDGAFGITETVEGPPDEVDNGKDTETKVERDKAKVLDDILTLERDLDKDIHDR